MAKRSKRKRRGKAPKPTGPHIDPGILLSRNQPNPPIVEGYVSEETKRVLTGSQDPS